MTARWRISPTAEQIDAERAAGRRPIAVSTYTAMGKFDEALADCNAVIEKMPKYQFVHVQPRRGLYGKGDLDAALKDYNTVLGVNPNNVRAHSDRGQLFERRRDLAQARADYRSAAFALTHIRRIEVAMARKTAQERLAALDAARARAPQTPDAASRSSSATAPTGTSIRSTIRRATPS